MIDDLHKPTKAAATGSGAEVNTKAEGHRLKAESKP